MSLDIVVLIEISLLPSNDIVPLISPVREIFLAEANLPAEVACFTLCSDIFSS
jgi:hypothetical protein